MAEGVLTQRLQVQALAQFGCLPAGVDLIVMRQQRTPTYPLLPAAPVLPPPLPAITPAEALAASADAFAALNSALSGVAVASIKYHSSIEFSCQICLEFSVEEGSNYALSGPLHAAHIALKSIVTHPAFHHKASLPKKQY